VTIRLGGVLGVGVGGEIVNVTHVFQPWGRFSNRSGGSMRRI